MTTSTPTVAMLPAAAIQVDPGRFQFRVHPSPSGTTERLSGCAIFRQELAGALLIWRDPEGIDWLADGHHRLALARRCGVERLAVLYLVAANAAEARAQAAPANIAQSAAGHQEVARFLRAAGADRAQLAAWGISTRSPLLRDALPLVELEPSLFAKAVTGELELAAAIPLAACRPPPLACDSCVQAGGWAGKPLPHLLF